MGEKSLVLIVDDEPSARDTLEAFLFQEGYDLAFAASGSEALACLDGLAPDVILLDVMMPGMDGLKVCQRLKTDKRWRHIPIILVTALDGKEDLALGLAAGADDFLSKPVNGLELRARVRSMLHIKKQHDELEMRVQERTAELSKANEALHTEVTERKRVEEALKTFARIQAALFQLSTDLAVALDETDICWKVVRGLHDTLVYDYLGLFLVDQSTGERVLQASIGWPDAPSDWRIPPGYGLSERPLLDGQLHYTPDVTRDPCYVPGLNSGAEVDVPLQIGGEVFGVLVVESAQPNAFDQDDFAVLTAAANQASIAIERARENQALKEAEARYRSLFDGVPLGLYRSTPAGRFLDANPALVRMLGYPDIESLLAVNAVEVYLNAEEHGRWQAVLEREGVVRGWELQLRRHDGTVVWMEGNVQAVRDQDGCVLHYEGSLQDITERKRAEEQLRHYAAELEQANEEIKAFAYTVSHDLRAPLVNLKGFAAELRAALAVVGSAAIITLPHLDEKRRPVVMTAIQEDLPEALGFIDSSVTRMDSLTKALLKLSRLGRRELRLEPIDVDALVQATLKTLSYQIQQRQVEMTVGPLPEVVADRTSMEQIIGNLLTNAVLYLDTDRPGEIQITGERDHNETTFRVRDNGCGIAEEDMDKVFAPFRRAGKQDIPGEGMGLPYVQALVRRHGGRIWCQSQLGRGSTFYFTIPTNIKHET
jgi:PAS domain S-box-containing protein